MVTESAEAIPANVREIASVAGTTAKVFMAAFPFGCLLPITKGHGKSSQAHNLRSMIAITLHDLLSCGQFCSASAFG
jgi:hypothetical protein